MHSGMRKSWRDAATLIVLSRQNRGALSQRRDNCVNYDILLQTRLADASFPNSIVFPGGVSELSDSAEQWLRLFYSFGYTDRNFEALHCKSSPLTPIFFNNPIKRHISLRITAIREAFEELGFLICSSDHRENQNETWADIITNIDVKYWQERVSKDPTEFFNLCKEYKCYPDIWSLHYWSDWLTPATFQKRFDTAFFVTALENKPSHVKSSTEVVDVQWLSPTEALHKNKQKETVLQPPQAYELTRLSHFTDITELILFAQKRSCRGNELFYPVLLQAKNGKLLLLPGDDLYPSNVNYNEDTICVKEKTILQLRQDCHKLHRLEKTKSGSQYILQNYEPSDHINMGNIAFSFHYL